MPEKTDTPKAREADVAADPKTQGKVTPDADHDRVVMASRRADGTPDQTDPFEYIGDKDTAIAAAKVQLGQQAASAVDIAIRGVTAGPGGPGTASAGEPDPAVQEIKDAHDEAIAAAEKKAEAEVKAHHAGLGDRS